MKTIYFLYFTRLSFLNALGFVMKSIFKLVVFLMIHRKKSFLFVVDIYGLQHDFSFMVFSFKPAFIMSRFLALCIKLVTKLTKAANWTRVNGKFSKLPGFFRSIYLLASHSEGSKVGSSFRIEKNYQYSFVT